MGKSLLLPETFTTLDSKAIYLFLPSTPLSVFMYYDFPDSTLREKQKPKHNPDSPSPTLRPQPSGPRRGRSGAMAEEAKVSGESQDTEVKIQQPAEKIFGGPPRRSPRSVLKVSQLLLRAIALHKGLTLATLKKELGNAGYQVRRKCVRHSGEAPKSDIKGTLLRVSGSNAAGYFRVWKIPKPKRKPGRPRLEECARSSRGTSAGPRGSRKPRVRRRVAKKAKEVWRRSTRGNGTVRRRPRAKDPVRSRAKEEKRAKGMDVGRGRTLKENRPRTREEKRSREEKKHDPEKPVKRSIQRSISVKIDPRPARTKTSTKSESPRSAAAGNL
ncbi:testis-specific H1 histone [Pteropus alecto]|nr:testis-specific H1 histone [Pteropus alecto]